MRKHVNGAGSSNRWRVRGPLSAGKEGVRRELRPRAKSAPRQRQERRRLPARRTGRAPWPGLPYRARREARPAGRHDNRRTALACLYVDIFTEIARNPETLTAKAINNPPTIMLAETTTRANGAPPKFPPRTAMQRRARLPGSTARWRAAERLTESACSARHQSNDATPAIERSDAVLMFPTRWSLGLAFRSRTPTSGEPARVRPFRRGRLARAATRRRIGFGYTVNRRPPSS